jgi:hypothetical protein
MMIDPEQKAAILAALDTLKAEFSAGVDRICAQLERMRDEMVRAREGLPNIPNITAEQARNLARLHRGMAERLIEYGLASSAASHTRDAKRWDRVADDIDKRDRK